MSKCDNIWRLSINLTLLFCVLLLIMPLTIIPCASEPTQSYTFEIDMEIEKTAHVGPGDSGVVTFNGTVEVECTQPTIVVVELSTEDTWSTSTVDPTTMYFRRTGKQEFTIQVTVPHGECCEKTGNFQLNYNSRLYGSGGASMSGWISGLINIAQFYDLSLSSAKPAIETTPGSTNQLDLTIKNTGNGNDTFSISIVDNDKFSTKVSSTLIDICMDENVTVPITINIPSSQNIIGEHEINAQVISINGQKQGMPPKNYSFEISIKESIETSEPDINGPEFDNEENNDDGNVAEEKRPLEEFTFSMDSPYFVIGSLLIIIIIIIILLLIRIRVKN
jgi:hypothetical protein